MVRTVQEATIIILTAESITASSIMKPSSVSAILLVSKLFNKFSVGSAKEAEEFDHLSPEESKRRLGILLQKMDLNSDKQIDRKELKAWILRSFK